MDNIFRIKKSRDTSAKSKASETFTGTLDSIHQSLISEMRDTNIEELHTRKVEIEKELGDMQDMYKATKLQDEIRTIHRRLAQDDPLKDY